MDITLGQTTIPFQPWQPSDGQVFQDHFALDTETTLIDDNRPWIPPAYVLGAACDARRGFFIPRNRIVDFLALHADIPFILHNAAFDLAVLNILAPQLDIYDRVEQGLVWDTRILHRLLTLATEGHTARGRGESTLDACNERYLGFSLAKDVTDSEGKPIRTSYGQWLNCPSSQIPTPYLHYLGLDVMATFGVYRELRARIVSLLDGSGRTWGHVSEEWLEQQVKRWGPLTHHIQLRAEIVLKEITATGLHIDLGNRQQVTATVDAVIQERLEVLRGYGYIPGEGSGKAMQSILQSLSRQHSGFAFQRTADGKFAASEEALRELESVEPFVKTMLEWREAAKLKNSFLAKMETGTVHPSFDVLARTGRTTSFGAINAQNLPRDDRIRSCFVPSPGHVFLVLDYKTVEMATLAQSTQSQFGLESEMAAAINRGDDLHAILAAHIGNKPVDKVTKDERQKAKAINFGKPGGMGNATLTRYAKASYGVELSEAEAEAMSDSWMARFPEMKQFLEDSDGGQVVAELLGLTAIDHYEATDDSSFIDRADEETPAARPSKILGWMALKTYRCAEPLTNAGKPYSKSLTTYFWDRLNEQAHLLPDELQLDIQNRTPSEALRKAVQSVAGRADVFTLTGRLRADASYAARHNTVFQGLAADGAKLAMWAVWRAGYRIANFIHDELIVEVPEQSNLALHAEIVRRLMIRGMRMVVPDVLIDVDYAVSRAWSKKAKQQFDDFGRLVPWVQQIAG